MVFTNSKGTQYYSSKKISIIGRNHIKVPTYFFRKEKKDDYIEELPANMTVSETKTGMPVIKHL